MKNISLNKLIVKIVLITISIFYWTLCSAHQVTLTIHNATDIALTYASFSPSTTGGQPIGYLASNDSPISPWESGRITVETKTYTGTGYLSATTIYTLGSVGFLKVTAAFDSHGNLYTPSIGCYAPQDYLCFTDASALSVTIYPAAKIPAQQPIQLEVQGPYDN